MPLSPQTSPTHLSRTLTPFETLGLSLGGLLLWLGTAPSMHGAIGAQAMLIWAVGTVAGVMLNLQVKHLGQLYPDVAGGTPSYLTRLLQNYPAIARYSAIGYWLGWISIPPMNAIILTDLIQAQLDPIGLSIPVTALRILFTLLPFLLAFSGNRALGVVHSFFTLPSIGLLMAFCLCGMVWFISFGSSLPLPPQPPALAWDGWLKWYFMAVYAVYGAETGAAFIAESQRPQQTQRAIVIAAMGLPIVYLGGSWVMTALSSTAAGTSPFLLLESAASLFWGNQARLMITVLIGCGALLSSTTAVAIAPRILYQLASDRHIASVFRIVSPRGIFGPGLCLTLLFSLICLMWGNVDRVVMITGTGYLIAMMAFHWGMWLQRGRPESRWAHGSLGLLGLETMALIGGGIAWSWQDLLLGLLLPLSVCLINRGIARSPWRIFQVHWWQQLYQPKPLAVKTDFFFTQVISLLCIITFTTTIGWCLHRLIEQARLQTQISLLILGLIVATFIGVAIAGWSSLPQVLAINEARELAEQMQAELTQKTQQLEVTLQELKETYELQFAQSEKMAALGNLVAGVAHEINNPVGCIVGNVNVAQTYIQDLFRLIDLYAEQLPQTDTVIAAELAAIDLDFLREDLPKLMQAMQDGGDRITAISKSLRTMARTDSETKLKFNLHEGLDSTILILRHRLKANQYRPAIVILQEYGQIPDVECFPGQLNQVFMNILANAIDMFDEMAEQHSYQHFQIHPQSITIQTALTSSHQVEIRIRDNGQGMSEAIKARIFDPTFTTKGVGKGTGLGLAIVRQILEKHNGTLTVNSELGQGTEFRLCLPGQTQQ
jgi:signal transduction histidine kinase